MEDSIGEAEGGRREGNPNNKHHPTSTITFPLTPDRGPNHVRNPSTLALSLLQVSSSMSMLDAAVSPSSTHDSHHPFPSTLCCSLLGRVRTQFVHAIPRVCSHFVRRFACSIGLPHRSIQHSLLHRSLALSARSVLKSLDRSFDRSIVQSVHLLDRCFVFADRSSASLRSPDHLFIFSAHFAFVFSVRSMHDASIMFSVWWHNARLLLIARSCDRSIALLARPLYHWSALAAR